jgi:hypothetical protein
MSTSCARAEIFAESFSAFCDRLSSRMMMSLRVMVIRLPNSRPLCSTSAACFFSIAAFTRGRL